MRRLIGILLCGLLLTPMLPESGLFGVDTYAQTTKKKNSTKKKSSETSSKSYKKTSKKSDSKRSVSKKTSKSKSQQPTTSADAKKQQQKAQQEIKQTKQQIEENNKLIKKGLNNLNSLNSDISVSENQIASLSSKLTALNSQLDELNGKIAQNEQELSKLREKYLKVVKKMRLVKGNTDRLTFVFASKSFSQAYRRLRYLREFSEWRKNQVKQINDLQSQLKEQHSLLAQTKKEIDEVISKEQKVKSNLIAQRKKQDAIVAELRQNGDALNRHLENKQKEVNQLKNKIADLIAKEQKAAEEKRRKEEAMRREAEEKAKKEAEEKAKREAEEKAKQQKTPVSNDKANKKKQDKNKDDKKDERTYADARKCKDKSKSNNEGIQGNVVVNSTFEASKGKLPRPVVGQFKVVVPFGRHSLPDLPSVEYDNPGIDAEVAAGASAVAVFEGEVSGVYILKGFDTVIIINHGSYYTVYGNIATPSVKVGDKVKSGQVLGKLYSDSSDNNRTVIHFEVWKGREKQNPMHWIK